MRRPLRLVLLLLASAPSLASAQPAHGPGLAAIDAQRRARARDLEADKGRAEDTAAQIARLRRELVELGRSERGSEGRASGASDELLRLNAEEAMLKIRMGRTQGELSRLLGALQMYQRNPPPPLLVEPRSARDAVRAAILVKAIAPELERRSRVFVAQVGELNRVRRQAVLASGVLLQAQTESADRRARIEDLIAQKRALQAQLDEDARAAEADVRRLAARARSMGELVQALDSREPDAPAVTSAVLTAPVQGEIDRRFGEAWPGHTRSQGWSWRTPAGAVVLSPAEARVDYAGPLKGWGVVVILRLGGGYRVVLAGLGEAAAETGQAISAGEPVGRMTNAAKAPELYLEVRRGAVPVDPAPWLARAG